MNPLQSSDILILRNKSQHWLTSLYSCSLLQVCVSECPSENWFYTGGETEADRAKLICRDNVDPMDDSKAVRDLVMNGRCAFYYVESRSCELRVALTFPLTHFFLLFLQTCKEFQTSADSKALTGGV